MQIEIGYFGMITEIADTSVDLLDFPDQTLNVEELKSRLIERYPALSLIQFQVAINRKLVATGEICESDEIVLLPPFSGG